ncbi:MAG: hypothetical protein AAF827_09315 [Cyanobacteria bacterium P01_D01_bin.6]
MNPKLAALFEEPEKAYLKADELNTLSQFVSSLPERINFYQRLRNEEVTLMQTVANSLQQQFPQVPEEKLKRSLQSGILMVRYAAMAMLIDDANLVTNRLATWLPEIAEAYQTKSIDAALYQLIKTQFAGRFSPAQMALLSPGLNAAERLVASDQAPAEPEEEITSESLVGLF